MASQPLLVPFYFCPRSVMLYLLHKGNHVDLNYAGGQAPILPSAGRYGSTRRLGESVGRKWAISRGNAGAKYAQFHNSIDPMAEWNWDHIQSTDWRDQIVKEPKQSEFLVHESLPWECIERIGVISDTMHSKLTVKLTDCSHKPPVSIQPDWYY